MKELIEDAIGHQPPNCNKKLETRLKARKHGKG
jgi:hypothetical protein